MKAVILAGGKGTRLAPYTTILPKPLMPIGEMPILEVLLRQIKRAGITQVVLTVGHLGSLLRSYFGDGAPWGLNITYSHEQVPLGTTGPLSLVEGLQDAFLVANGDVLTDLDLQDFQRYHREQGGIATIAVYKKQVKIDLGVIHWDDAHTLTGYTEKPTFDYTVSMGVYMFDAAVLAYIPRNQYLDFPDLILKLIADGKKVVGYPFDGYWKDLGRPDDYKEASEDFERMRSRFLPE